MHAELALHKGDHYSAGTKPFCGASEAVTAISMQSVGREKLLDHTLVKTNQQQLTTRKKLL